MSSAAPSAGGICAQLGGRWLRTTLRRHKPRQLRATGKRRNVVGHLGLGLRSDLPRRWESRQASRAIIQASTSQDLHPAPQSPRLARVTGHDGNSMSLRY